MNGDGSDPQWHRAPYTSLAEAAADEPPNGVYLVARTYRGGLVLELDAHFDRMERSAHLQGRSITVAREAIRRALRAMAAELFPSGGDIRFRVTLVLDPDPWYRLSVEPAADLPTQLRTHGIVCRLQWNAARADPEIKSTDWIAARRTLPGGAEVYEHLLVDGSGAILEGATSNFYAVVDGTVRTAGSGVLQGIARRIVLSVVERLSGALELKLAAPTVADLADGRIAEAFITSATRGVVPVRTILNGAGTSPGSDAAPGTGANAVDLGDPGPWTRRIAAGYEEWLGEHLLPL
jgi:branched-chain amino acid aminotransferase